MSKHYSLQAVNSTMPTSAPALMDLHCSEVDAIKYTVSEF